MTKAERIEHYKGLAKMHGIDAVLAFLVDIIDAERDNAAKAAQTAGQADTHDRGR
jgi:hypothetical protein